MHPFNASFTPEHGQSRSNLPAQGNQPLLILVNYGSLRKVDSVQESMSCLTEQPKYENAVGQDCTADVVMHLTLGFLALSTCTQKCADTSKSWHCFVYTISQLSGVVPEHTLNKSSTQPWQVFIYQSQLVNHTMFREDHNRVHRQIWCRHHASHRLFKLMQMSPQKCHTPLIQRLVTVPFSTSSIRHARVYVAPKTSLDTKLLACKCHQIPHHDSNTYCFMQNIHHHYRDILSCTEVVC